jgi:hypothetical protein
LALAFFWEMLNGSLVLCTQVPDETLGHVTKITAEGESEKNKIQTFLTGVKSWSTKSGVNLFMNKFKKLGFIKYNGGLLINSSLLSVVLHD